MLIFLKFCKSQTNVENVTSCFVHRSRFLAKREQQSKLTARLSLSLTYFSHPHTHTTQLHAGVDVIFF